MIAPGQRVGKYVVERRLGAGGMGEVYRGYDETLQRPVAIKVLPEADVLSPEARARMLREARAASALRHPNIVGIHEVGEDDERTYLVMELVEGETLADLVKRRGALPLAEAAGLIRQVGAALAHAHQAGFVHRDVKTANLMLDHHGVVKVLDFGLSKRVKDAAEPEPPPPVPLEAVTVPGGKAPPRVSGEGPTVQAPHRPALGDDITIAGHGMGTAGCSAPELMDGRTADARADVFSMGVVLYELVTGRRPFDGASWDEIRGQIGAEDYRAARELGVAPAVDAVIAKALRADPDARWPSAASLVAALDAASAGASARRKARAPWLIAGAIGAAGAVAVAAVMVRRGDGAVAPGAGSDAAALAPVVVALEVDAAPAIDAGPAGPALTRLTTLDGCAQRPAFLDDDTLVFDLTRADRPADLWKLELATGKASALVATAADECCGARGRGPAEVVFVARDRADAARSALATLDVSSGARTELAAGQQRAVVTAGAAYLYVTGDGRELRQWADQQDQAYLDVAGVRPSAVAIDRDGRRLLLSGDGPQAGAAICTVDLASPAVRCKPARRPHAVRADFGATGVIYYPSEDGVRALDASGGDRIAVGDVEPSGGLAVSPAGAHLVFSDCTARGVVIDTGASPPAAIGDDDQVVDLATGPGGLLAYTDTPDVLIVRLPDGTRKPFRAADHRFREPQLDGGGARVAVVLDGPTPGIYEGAVADGTLRRITDRAEDERPLYLADGSIVFTRGQSVLRVVPGETPEMATPQPRRARGVDRRNRRVLVEAEDGALTWLDPVRGVESPGPVATPPDGGVRVDVALSPDGRWLLIAGAAGLWRAPADTAGGLQAVRYRPEPGRSRAGAAIGDDGHVLIIEQRLHGELWGIDAPAGAPW